MTICNPATNIAQRNAWNLILCHQFQLSGLNLKASDGALVRFAINPELTIVRKIRIENSF